MKEKFLNFIQWLKLWFARKIHRLTDCAFPLTKRQKKGSIVCILCLSILVILIIVTTVMESTLYDEGAAKRWSEDGGTAQISCFYPVNYIEDSEYYFLNMEHTIQKALDDASMQSENEKARSFCDAYSLTGNITIESDYGTTTIQAVGVSGDFFFFHPIAMLNGGYLMRDAVMKDGIIIDEDAAWQLFGSNDVADMNVTIAGLPYHIEGVANRDEGHFENAAGLSKSVCYVPIETLLEHGIVTGSYTYEIVMPDPVNDFAMTTVNTALNQEEEIIKVVENSKRYETYPLFLVIKDFGIRSMGNNGIVYPYWENNARAYEDLFAFCLSIKLILIFTVLILVILYIHGLRAKLRVQKKEEENYEKNY